MASLFPSQGSQGSQESFHSSRSQQPSTPPPPAASPAPSSSNAHTVVLRAADLPVYDVDAYLNNPKVQALLSGNANNTPTNPGQGMKSHGSVAPSTPTVKTTHYVSALNLLCQKRGIVPQFEIDGNQSGFWGWLKVGNETISRDERWSTKKDAKEALAERGVEVVKGMQEREKGPVDGSPPNWVGLLQEYHISEGSGPVYKEYAIGVGFAYTCNHPSYPGTFGSATVSFPTKKAARANAAKEAVKYLIDQGLTNPDGSHKSKKKVKLGTAVKVEGKKLEVQRDTTYAQRVNDLCPILGLTAPTYRLSATADAAPNFLSGAAYFSGEPRLPERYGEVRNIFGKKAAKEECARAVWEVLKGVAAERGVNVGIRNEVD